MRITRNYRNGMMSEKRAGGSSARLQNLLKRSQSAGKAAGILGTGSQAKSSNTRNYASAAKSERFYSDMKYHAGQVGEYAAALSAGKKNSIYDKAQESGSTAEIQSDIKGFVNQYNNMLQDLKESGTRTDQSQLSQLDSISRNYSVNLASTGVTRKADGTLVVDEKKLAETDLETLKKVWGGESGFAGLAARRAASVASTAEQNRKAQSSLNYSNPFDRSGLYGNYGSKGNYFNFFR